MSINNHKNRHTWSKYYNSIRESCPFSGFAFTNGALLHLPFRSYEHTLQNEGILRPMKLWGCVYEGVEATPDQLEQWTTQQNSRPDREIEYFWSHPDHSPNGNATAIPVIIQQRLDLLERARRGEFDVIRREDSTDTRITPQALDLNSNYGQKRKRS